jgi:hypothetical protein
MRHCLPCGTHGHTLLTLVCELGRCPHPIKQPTSQAAGPHKQAMWLAAHMQPQSTSCKLLTPSQVAWCSTTKLHPMLPAPCLPTTAQANSGLCNGAPTASHTTACTWSGYCQGVAQEHGSHWCHGGPIPTCTCNKQGMGHTHTHTQPTGKTTIGFDTSSPRVPK